MNVKTCSSLAVILTAFLSSCRVAHAITLEPQDIVVAAQIGPAANKDFGLVLVDPANGNRTILSDNTTGTGPDFSKPEGVTIEPDGNLLVTDQNAGPSGSQCIIRVDPATGDRTIMSGSGVGTGPLYSAGFFGMYGIVEAAGTIYLAEGGVLTVDPLTGNRAVLPTQGSPGGLAAVGLAIDGSTLLLADYNFLLYQIDLTTGNQINNTVTRLEYMPGVTVSHDGTVYVCSRSGNSNNIPAVYSANLTTGILTLVSGGAIGDGPTMGGLGPAALGTERNGTILLTEDTLNAVLSIDPVTGYRLILSDATHGAGPTITAPQGIMVVPNVPEPSTLIIFLAGSLLLAWRGSRQGYPSGARLTHVGLTRSSGRTPTTNEASQ